MTLANATWNMFLAPPEVAPALLWVHLLSAVIGVVLACWALWSAVGDDRAYTGPDKSTHLEGIRGVRNEALHLTQQIIMLVIASVSFSNGWLFPVIDPSVRVLIIALTWIPLIGAAANRNDRIKQYQYARERDRRHGERNHIAGNEPEEVAG